MEAFDDRLAQLYQRYGGAIYARCYCILNNKAAAEDATQETFLRVHRHLERAPDTEDALRWIYRIATNYCLNEIRNQMSRSGAVETISLLSQDLEPENQLLDRDLGRRLVAVAPEPMGVAAWLHLVDGMDQAEVAKVLGVSRRTVVSYVSTFVRNAQKFITRSVA
ncbi:MAG: hypothetical protein RJA70_2751 [Pseudomonadota bacterium]|jgi:RNA polymerase sigma-70 factor (ECF subfamily)